MLKSTINSIEININLEGIISFDWKTLSQFAFDFKKYFTELKKIDNDFIILVSNDKNMMLSVNNDTINITQRKVINMNRLQDIVLEALDLLLSKNSKLYEDKLDAYIKIFVDYEHDGSTTLDYISKFSNVITGDKFMNSDEYTIVGLSFVKQIENDLISFEIKVTPKRYKGTIITSNTKLSQLKSKIRKAENEFNQSLLNFLNGLE